MSVWTVSCTRGLCLVCWGAIWRAAWSEASASSRCPAQSCTRTAVELQHRDLPVELADDVRPFGEWALQRGLPQRFNKAPFYGYPWDR